MLQINDLVYRIGGRTLMDGATVTIPEGAKVGLVGRNGTGKTTLFKLLTGDLAPESGSIKLPRNARIGQVRQEAPATDDSLLDTVLAADLERTELLAQADTETDPMKISDIHTRLIDIDAHSAEARAGAILGGLGFDAAAQQRPCKDFSGGWRMRVALAAILFSQPDFLLLDEPTNYLDLEGTMWLENYIGRYPYTVVLISHDRDLLNKAVGTIVHLEELKLTSYKGGYDNFERQRREKMELAGKMQVKQEANRKHLEAFVNRFRAKASKARQAQSRLKMLEKLKPISAIVDSTVKPIQLPDPEKTLSPPIISMENASVGYDGKPVLKKLDLRIDHDDRIALLGSNGNGKSTFAKLLSNRLPVMAGGMHSASKLSIAYFAQHQLDELVPEQSPADHVRKLLPGAKEGQVRARVSQFGLPTDRMDLPAKSLSGGEKARLLLGLATFNGPNMIILDEPTNHLDIDSREALIHAINGYQGAVILISHDRHLVETCADSLWLVDQGTIHPFDGDMNDYRRHVLKAGSGKKGKKAAAEAAAAAAEVAAETERKTGQEKRKENAGLRKTMAPLRKDIQAAERNIEKLQKKIAELDNKLASADLYQKDPESATKYAKERADTERDLQRTEEKWLAMSAEYEEAVSA
ncbi:MAG: ABC-F family ATP-binding cassette domain-containing protein [Stappiaceae bacterium]